MTPTSIVEEYTTGMCLAFSDHGAVLAVLYEMGIDQEDLTRDEIEQALAELIEDATETVNRQMAAEYAQDVREG